MTKKPVIRPLRPGERVGGFRVEQLLAEGGMARLYRVRHPRHRRPLVMKVPRLEAGAPVSTLVAHENEWRILERLHADHAPRLIAHGDLETLPYLVMEYLEHAPLEDALRAGKLPIKRIIELMIPVCRAVHELHCQNVIHLDLNPANIRARGDGEIVLIDFGIAHHAALPDLIETAFGEAEGTTPYIAPEQVKHVRHDSRSDIYALGAILYRLATGEYPFGRPNLLSVSKRLVEPPLPPRLHRPDLPPWLQEVILRCLRIRPDRRYATARQLAYALAHPDSVTVTHRGRQTRRAGWWTRLRLWWRSLYLVFDEGAPVVPYERLSAAPHVLVALDLGHSSAALQQVLLATVRRLAQADAHSHFTCLTVVPPGRNGAAEIMAMRHWVQPLRLSRGRMVFHALPGRDPAAVIVQYARTHLVDQIVLGARGSSAWRRFLGSVSARVVAQAACTVSVVRSRRDRPPAPARQARRRR
ncbi:MAG: bifunctional serine/threonine-protein kinase/universal stress protein [Pseudomonadota bacterium]